MSQEHMGLRERKKQMTRETIATAALKLTQHKGVARVTIDEIAREAFVSPRTVSNYFPTKEEAVIAGGQFGYEAMFEEYSASTEQSHPLEILRDIFVKHAREYPDHLRMATQLVDLEKDNPTLKPYRVGQIAELMLDLSKRIATCTDTDLKTDPYPSITASAAIMAMTTSLNIWSNCDCVEGRLPELIEQSFNTALAGYPRTAD